jgi:hypothetical protein
MIDKDLTCRIHVYTEINGKLLNTGPLGIYTVRSHWFQDRVLECRLPFKILLAHSLNETIRITLQDLLGEKVVFAHESRNVNSTGF